MARLNFNKPKTNQIQNRNVEEEFFEDDAPSPTDEMEQKVNLKDKEHDNNENLHNEQNEIENTNEDIHDKNDNNLHDKNEKIYDNITDNGDGVYGESPMPEDRYQSLDEIAAYEKANIAFEKENMERLLNERIEVIKEDFKLLSEGEKKYLIKNIMVSDKSLGDVLKNIHNNDTEINDNKHDKETIEDYKRNIEELKQKLVEHDNLKKQLEELKESLRKTDNEKKSQEEESEHDVLEGIKEEGDKKKDNNAIDSSESILQKNEELNRDEDDRISRHIDTNNNLDRLKTIDRSHQTPERPYYNNGQQIHQAHHSPIAREMSSFGGIGGELTNIRDSIAKKNYRRVVRDINECVDLTKEYNEDIHKFNNDAKNIGFIDIENDKTLSEQEKKEKMNELYNKNPSFMSLAKRIAKNGRKIPFLHEKISDGLDASERHGYDTNEARRTYHDIVSTTNLEKPLVSPPSLNLKEIAKKIAETIKIAFSKLNNMFVKKDSVKSIESPEP